MLSCRSLISNRISQVGLHWSQSYSRFRNREISVLGLPFTSIAWSPVWFLCPSGGPMFCQLSLFWAMKWIWKEAFLDLLSTDLPERRKNHETPPPLQPLPGPRIQQEMYRIQSTKASTNLSTTISGCLKCVRASACVILCKKTPQWPLHEFTRKLIHGIQYIACSKSHVFILNTEGKNTNVVIKSGVYIGSVRRGLWCLLARATPLFHINGRS